MTGTRDIDSQKQDIREELERLKNEFKIELPKKIAEAREYGDLKENAEYHAARERQSFVQARIAQLTEQLNQLNDINVSDIPDDRIGFGSVVTVYDEIEEEEVVFHFVSSGEVNPSEGKISASSPIGAALMNKKAGESVEITIPAGKKQYMINKVITFHGTELKA